MARRYQVALTFLGHADHESIRRYLHSADVFVMPSLNEGMSNALLEAMACGLPVITTDTGGAMGLIDGNGFIVPKRDHSAIADCVYKFLRDRSLLKTMGDRSRVIASKMSWQAMAQAYVVEYNKALGCA